jgi:cysteine desulfurase
MLVDAVQGLGRLDISPQALGADFVILSAHKAGGPKGAGALLLGDAGLAPMPLIRGGGQENYHRAGTENVAAIAGFGAAVENLPQNQQWDEIARLRDLLESGLRTISSECRLAAPVVFGASEARLANTACFAVAGIRAETALISLDLAGIAASSGSACSSGKVKKSHVLEAMSVQDDLAACALRTSLGPSSTMSEIARFLAAWKDMAGRMAKSAA